MTDFFSEKQPIPKKTIFSELIGKLKPKYNTTNL
jgi:hypothetical protein